MHRAESASSTSWASEAPNQDVSASAMRVTSGITVVYRARLRHDGHVGVIDGDIDLLGAKAFPPIIFIHFVDVNCKLSIRQSKPWFGSESRNRGFRRFLR